jgi:hypothetical protein
MSAMCQQSVTRQFCTHSNGVAFRTIREVRPWTIARNRSSMGATLSCSQLYSEGPESSQGVNTCASGANSREPAVLGEIYTQPIMVAEETPLSAFHMIRLVVTLVQRPINVHRARDDRPERGVLSFPIRLGFPSQHCRLLGLAVQLLERGRDRA